jgi:hypothetical protein
VGLRGPNAGAYRVPHLPPPSRLEHRLKCPGCGRWFVSSRRDAVVCGAACHQRVMRRARATVHDEQPPPDELVVSDEAIKIFSKMRALESVLRCDCPNDTADPDTMCANCKKLWRMNTRLCQCLNVPAWQFAYWHPNWQSRRPMQDAIARFHSLEKAAAMAKQKPRPPKRGRRPRPAAINI